MTFRVTSEAKPCFDFTTEVEEEAENMALRVAVITGRATSVITVEVCMTCTTEIDDENPRTGSGITCLSCGETAVDNILDADEAEGIKR